MRYFFDVVGIIVLDPRDASFDTLPDLMGEEEVEGSVDLSEYINDGVPPFWELSISLPETTLASTQWELEGTVFTWTAIGLAADTNYVILLVLTHPTDSTVEVCAYLALHVTDVIPPSAPAWLTIPTHSGHTGTAFSINLNNFVTGHPDPTISRVSGTGYTLSNGILSGTRPSTGQTENFTFRATNTEGSEVSGNVRIATTVPA